MDSNRTNLISPISWVPTHPIALKAGASWDGVGPPCVTSALTVNHPEWEARSLRRRSLAPEVRRKETLFTERQCNPTGDQNLTGSDDKPASYPPRCQLRSRHKRHESLAQNGDAKCIGIGPSKFCDSTNFKGRGHCVHLETLKR